MDDNFKSVVSWLVDPLRGDRIRLRTGGPGGGG